MDYLGHSSRMCNLPQKLSDVPDKIVSLGHPFNLLSSGDYETILRHVVAHSRTKPILIYSGKKYRFFESMDSLRESFLKERLTLPLSTFNLLDRYISENRDPYYDESEGDSLDLAFFFSPEELPIFKRAMEVLSCLKRDFEVGVVAESLSRKGNSLLGLLPRDFLC